MQELNTTCDISYKLSVIAHTMILNTSLLSNTSTLLRQNI